jgi:hypothetical protein
MGVDNAGGGLVERISVCRQEALRVPLGRAELLIPGRKTHASRIITYGLAVGFAYVENIG